MKKYAGFVLCFILHLFISVSYSQTPTEADHESLRELLKKSTVAMNEQKFDDLRPYLADKFSIITLDNNKFNSLDEFKAYWDKMFKGDKAKLKSITITPIADEKTDFPADNVGIVDGTAQQTYRFTDGDERTIDTRWSAVVSKEHNQWKIVTVHFSGNILDNPVLSALKNSLYKVAIGAALAGFVLGWVLAKMMRRSKATA